MQKDTRHPALGHLDVLVGEWETEATHSLLPGAVIHGRATFEWLEGGHFLIWRAQNDHPAVPNAIALLGGGPSGGEASTDVDGGLAMHYFDSRGVVRVYQMDA